VFGAHHKNLAGFYRIGAIPGPGKNGRRPFPACCWAPPG